MEFRFDYSEEKDQLLKETRGIGFGDVINAYRSGKKIADLKHRSKRRSKQRLLIVNIKGYAFVCPYVIDDKREWIFLKTIYPSRKLTKKYLGK